MNNLTWEIETRDGCLYLMANRFDILYFDDEGYCVRCRNIPRDLGLNLDEEGRVILEN